jgi:hypothetical protein
MISLRRFPVWAVGIISGIYFGVVMGVIYGFQDPLAVGGRWRAGGRGDLWDLFRFRR